MISLRPDVPGQQKGEIEKSVTTETTEAGSILPTLGDYPYKS